MSSKAPKTFVFTNAKGVNYMKYINWGPAWC